MRIALTGVSGFLGSVIARALHAQGHQVTGLVRPSSRRDHIDAYIDRYVVGDQADQARWPELLDGADCVIHNSIDWSMMRGDPPHLAEHLRTNLEASVLLLHASAPRQFIYVSSIAVHHDMMPRRKDEQGVNIVDEDHPLRPRNDYGALKAAVEAHLWAAHYEQGRHTSAVRPCAVYGIDPALDRSHGYSIIQALQQTGEYSRQGGGKYVHVEDVAAATAALVGNDAAAGKPFNLVDCYARHADWAAMAADVLGIDAKIDDSSPPRPSNMFAKDAVNSLGVALDRGHAGIREHLAQLAKAMNNAGA